LNALSAREHVDPSFFAMIDIALGDKDKAFYWLDRAVAANSSGLTELRVWPVYVHDLRLAKIRRTSFDESTFRDRQGTGNNKT